MKRIDIGIEIIVNQFEMFFNGCDIGRDVACFASRLVDLSGNVVVGFQNCRFYGPQLDSPNEDVTV